MWVRISNSVPAVSVIVIYILTCTRIWENDAGSALFNLMVDTKLTTPTRNDMSARFDDFIVPNPCGYGITDSPHANGLQLNVRPPTAPVWHSPELAHNPEYWQRHIGINPDGLPVKFYPIAYKCSQSHLNMFQPVSYHTDEPYVLMGGIKSMPRYYQYYSPEQFAAAAREPETACGYEVFTM